MAIDLLNIQPTVITRDLRDKYILIAAEGKFGKTTFMSSIPNALVLSFEPGLNARAGVYSLKVNRWSEMKLILAELAKPEVRARYTTICFDTLTVATELCIEYVCAQAGVESLGDVGFGKLYDVYEKELAKTLRKIAMMGYGLVFASHVEAKPVKFRGEEIERIQPQLDKRAFKVVNTLVDIIGIGVIDYDEEGKPHRYLFSGKNPAIAAGTRFTHFPPKLPFSYDQVKNALIEAIEKEGEGFGTSGIVDEREVEDYVPFEEVQAKASKLWASLIEKSESNADIVLKKAQDLFGREIRLSEITEYDQNLLESIVTFMESLLG